MSDVFAIAARRIYDGSRWHTDTSLVIRNGRVTHIMPSKDLPSNISRSDLKTGFLAPGFIDLQVNGGGGVLLNNDPSVEGIRTICETHARYGVTSLFPTLITDTNHVRDAAITAATKARNQNIPGFAGLHLEGPHLSVARKGAHDPKLIRAMNADDVATLIDAKNKVLHLISTVAAESVTAEQVATLTWAEIKVSLGHSDAGIADIAPLIAAGATMFTHLFNAMSQLSGREPGMVGMALQHGHVGLIADGHHVSSTSIKVALAAKKQPPGNIFLISDAMSCIGTDVTEFALNGRKILRRDGVLRLESGSLAGADIEMASAVRFMHQNIRIELGEAIRMATVYPRAAAGLNDVGVLRPGSRADFIWLNDNIETQATWIGGKKVFG